MTNVERGMIIIDTFTSVYEMIQGIQGKVDQGETWIDKNPQCGTAACIGGWLAHWYGTTTSEDGGCRFFQAGFRELAERLYLDTDRPVDSLARFFHVDHGHLWLKPFPEEGFYATNAYENGWSADFEEVVGTFLVFGFGLVAEYEDCND